MTDLPGSAWELTKSLMFPPKVRFPDHVWERIKVFAVDFCPRCGGECVLPGTIPCWRKDLWLRHSNSLANPYVFRAIWYSRGGEFTPV